MLFIHPNSFTCSHTTQAAANPPLSGTRVGGHTVYDAVCAEFLNWRGARGHGTADLLTENSLRGKRMLMLHLIIIAELLEQSDGYYTSSKITIMMLSPSLLSSLRRIDLKGFSTVPPRPLNYESTMSNQLELTDITSCYIRHPSVKITTSLPLCREPSHAMLTVHAMHKMCAARMKAHDALMDFTTFN